MGTTSGEDGSEMKSSEVHVPYIVWCFDTCSSDDVHMYRDIQPMPRMLDMCRCVHVYTCIMHIHVYISVQL